MGESDGLGTQSHREMDAFNITEQTSVQCEGEGIVEIAPEMC